MHRHYTLINSTLKCAKYDSIASCVNVYLFTLTEINVQIINQNALYFDGFMYAKYANIYI